MKRKLKLYLGRNSNYHLRTTPNGQPWLCLAIFDLVSFDGALPFGERIVLEYSNENFDGAREIKMEVNLQEDDIQDKVRWWCEDRQSFQILFQPMSRWLLKQLDFFHVKDNKFSIFAKISKLSP